MYFWQAGCDPPDYKKRADLVRGVNWPELRDMLFLESLSGFHILTMRLLLLPLLLALVAGSYHPYAFMRRSRWKMMAWPSWGPCTAVLSKLAQHPYFERITSQDRHLLEARLHHELLEDTSRQEVGGNTHTSWGVNRKQQRCCLRDPDCCAALIRSGEGPDPRPGCIQVKSVSGTLYTAGSSVPSGTRVPTLGISIG
eukprot:1147250-Pelagomonas_calceolata.AAC.7